MSKEVFEAAKQEIGNMIQQHPPIESGKFSTVRMRALDGNKGFLKYVNNPDSTSWEDLENEVLWSQQHRELLAEQGVLVPEVLQHDPNFNWAFFELYDRSSSGPYRTAGDWGVAADMAISVFKLPLQRPPLTNLEDWYIGRIDRFAKSAADLFRGRSYQKFTLEKIQALGKGAIDVSCLKPGIIHGDLKDENTLRTQFGNALVDGELGTLQIPPTTELERPRSRTEHDKPRFHDIAYYYHLLWQTVGALEARGFISHAKSSLENQGLFSGEESERELKLSAIERTLSMAYHYVLNPKPLWQVEDLRRKRSARYASLLTELLVDLE